MVNSIPGCILKAIMGGSLATEWSLLVGFKYMRWLLRGFNKTLFLCKKSRPEAAFLLLRAYIIKELLQHLGNLQDDIWLIMYLRYKSRLHHRLFRLK